MQPFLNIRSRDVRGCRNYLLLYKGQYRHCGKKDDNKRVKGKKDEINYKSFTSCHLRELIVNGEETPLTFLFLQSAGLGISDECETGEERRLSWTKLSALTNTRVGSAFN